MPAAAPMYCPGMTPREVLDTAQLIVAFGALAVSLAALWLVYRRTNAASRTARDALDAARRSAVAAEASAEAARQSAAESRRSNDLIEQQHQREAAAAAERRKANKVGWRVEYRRGDGYDLRNIGTETALEVTASAAGHPAALMRDMPDRATIRPGEAHPFVLQAAWQVPRPSQIEVLWKGRDDPLSVPMPPKH